MVAYQALKKKILPGGSDLFLSHVGVSAYAHYIHRNKGCVCKGQVHKIRIEGLATGVTHVIISH